MIDPVIDGVNQLGGALATPATEPDYADRFEIPPFVPQFPGDVPPGTPQRTVPGAEQSPEGIETLLPAAVSPLAPVTGTSSGGASSGGTPSSGASDDEAPASGSNMDQDKWLALAQAGFTLMSTGDFGKAGQAGLAAYSQAKQAAQDARKLEAELAFLDARTQAALRPPSGGGGRPSRAAIGDVNYLQGQVDNITAQISGLGGPDPTYLFGSLGGADPYATDRIRLATALEVAQGRLDAALASRGFPTSAASTSVPSIKTPSATQ